jgi:hypothetical protein
MYYNYWMFLTFFSRVFSQNVSKLPEIILFLTWRKSLQIIHFKAHPTFIEKIIFLFYNKMCNERL